MNKQIELIYKWSKMLLGNSIFHIRQERGNYYEKGRIRGYYSDLRHKVTGNTLLDNKGVPINITNENDTIYFPITIFQYGLGSYDLYLETGDKNYLDKFFKCIKWAVENQESNGGWETFTFKKSIDKYSSMAQGEGISLLTRAYKETNNKEYIEVARKALDFMLLPVENEGTTLYKNYNEFTFEECTKYRTILNGVIFSIWGLLDYVIITKDNYYKDVLQKSVNHLANILNDFDCGYWSYYDLDGNLTSPFYHDLHIEQLNVMYDLFKNNEFNYYAQKWDCYQKSYLKSKKAFILKVFQKLKTSNSDITLVK